MPNKHVHEVNPKRTVITMVLFVVIIVIGLVTLKSPRLTYTLTPLQTLNLVSSNSGSVYPYQLDAVLKGTIDTVILIDIRNKFEYSKGHIDGAENISAYDLTNKENIKRLKDLKKEGMAVILYGNNQLEANGPWMVFRQLGFDNVKLLLGGYQYYTLHKNDLAKTKDDKSYILMQPDYNYSEVAKATASPGSDIKKETKKAPVIKRKKKTKATAGGC